MGHDIKLSFRILSLALMLLSGAAAGIAGVSRTIQEQYKRDYENKAMFLKIPIYSEKQIIHISGQSFRADTGIGTPRYKVGDQLRVLSVDFDGKEIKFRLGGIAAPGTVEIGFQFDADLQESFPNREVFNRALQSTLTEGLKYTEIDDARRSYVEEQFERSVGEISNSASISRESVLKNIAPQLPAYQEARRENETLKSRVQDISAQLSQSQTENRKLEAELKAQQAEAARLKSANAALQEKIDTSTSQISRLGDELRDVKGSAQGYQRELASIQRSLNIKVDANRDLAAQISDLGQAMKKMQKESDALAGQIVSLRSDLNSQMAANAKLMGENQELKANSQKLQTTIAALTSNKDSLAAQYLKLSREKEKLDTFSQSVAAVRSRIREEKTEDGFHQGKADVYLKNVLIGTLNWSIPASLNSNENKNCEVAFSAESIDSIRLSPEERLLLRSLGDRIKMRVDLASDSSTMSVTPESGEPIREIGERDRSAWKWDLNNRGTQDAQFLITARLINRNSGEIPLFQYENRVVASNAVRQVRGYLQPIPLIAGIILGFLLFGIVGIFRRPAKAKMIPKRPLSAGTSEPPPHPTQKQL